PGWLALLVSLLALGSALLTFTGSLGLLRLKTFYQRMHAPTLASTLGLFLMLLAAFIHFSMLSGKPALNVILIGLLLTATTPITLLLLARAALSRRRQTDRPAKHADNTDSSGKKP